MKRKWPLLVAALVIIGCAGGDPIGTTGTTGVTGVTGTNGNTTGRDAATVSLSPQKSGRLDVYLVPGQGRAPGDLTADINILRFRDPSGNLAEQVNPPDMSLLLTGFNVQNRSFDSDPPEGAFPPFPVSRTFNTFDISFRRFRLEDENGNLNTLSNNQGTISMLDAGEFTSYRDRTTAVPFYLNDSMITIAGNTATLDVDEFLEQNRNPETGELRGHLADYVRFDISAVPNRPLMPSPLQFPPEESRAGVVFASGDNWALGDKNPRGVNGSNGLFVYLTQSSFFEGFYRPVDATTQVRSYELKQADPSYVGPDIRLITALKGPYRELDQVFTNLHDTEFILMPKSGDGPKQDVVVLRRNGTTIVDMWFGTVDYNTGGSPTFRIYPIRNLYPASTAGEIRGTLPANDLIGVGNNPVSIGQSSFWRNVRGGTYKFNGTPPAGLTSTGDFVVFRV